MNGSSFIRHCPGVVSPQLAGDLITLHTDLERTEKNLLTRETLKHTTDFQGQATLVDCGSSLPGEALLSLFGGVVKEYFLEVLKEDAGNYRLESTEFTTQRHLPNVGEPMPYFLDLERQDGVALGLMANLNTSPMGGDTVFPFQSKTLTGNGGDVGIFPLTWPFFQYGPEPKGGDKFLATLFCHFTKMDIT